MKKYRITTIGDKGGSTLHQVKIWQSSLQGKTIQVNGKDRELDITYVEVNERIIPEEIVKNTDLLAFNWIFQNSIAQIGLWKAKYGIKTVCFLDDYYEFDELNPTYKSDLERSYVKGQVIKYLVESDAVGVTTNKLATHVLQYNKNIFFNRNFLPIGEGQFKLKENTYDGNILKICIFGSVSHYSDWLSLKSIINRLAANKEITKRCEFHLLGYSKSKYWDEIVSIFKKKKNLKVFIKGALPVDSYMNLLDDMDICLVNLKDNEFNKCKSSLKLAELSIAQVLPIGSELYASKELKSLVVCKTPLDYEITIEKLLNKEIYDNTLAIITKNNLEDNKWEDRIEGLRKMFEIVANKDFKEKSEDLRVYGICYDDSQTTEYTRVVNKNITTGWRFEYQVFLDKLKEIKELPDNSWVSFLSHKFPHKSHLSKKVLYTVFNEVKDNNDMLLLSPSYWKNGREYLTFSDKQHPNLLNLLKKICDKLGVVYYDSPSFVTYSNFFLLKKEYMIDYIENWITPALDYIENDIWEEVNIDANYKSGINTQELEARTGCKFYNYTTFLLERLILMFIEAKKNEKMYSSNINEHFKVVNIL